MSEVPLLLAVRCSSALFYRALLDDTENTAARCFYRLELGGQYDGDALRVCRTQSTVTPLEGGLLRSFENKHFDRSAHAQVLQFCKFPELFVNIRTHSQHYPLAFVCRFGFWSRHKLPKARLGSFLAVSCLNRYLLLPLPYRQGWKVRQSRHHEHLGGLP